MPIWIRKPQEQEGTYQFSGTFLVTQAVMSSLTPEEITAIYLDIQLFVHDTGGVDYLQIYISDTGHKLYFIDQCNKEMMEDEKFTEEMNYCTLLFAHEY